MPAEALLHWSALLEGQQRLLYPYPSQLESATDALFGQSRAILQLDSDDATSLEQALLTFGNQETDFEAIGLASDTAWDSWIRQLTPDLPTMLTDTFLTYRMANTRFACFWQHVQHRLSPEGVNRVLSWYRTSLAAGK